MAVIKPKEIDDFSIPSELKFGNITTTVGSNTTSTTYTLSPNTHWSSSSVISGSYNPATTISAGAGGKITLQGENADIDMNGKSLKQWMEKVEERLNILTVNTELEAEWEELRELGNRYRELEKICKEKSEIWNKLKAMPNPEIK